MDGSTSSSEHYYQRAPADQTIVLSYREPDQSAEILEQFAQRDALDLLMRIANLKKYSLQRWPS